MNIRYIRLLLMVAGIMVWFPAFSQVLSLGIKQDKRTMFQAGVNIPVIFKSDKKYDFTIGADYTSKNPLQPSGLSPQITFVQIISIRIF